MFNTRSEELRMWFSNACLECRDVDHTAWLAYKENNFITTKEHDGGNNVPHYSYNR